MKHKGESVYAHYGKYRNGQTAIQLFSTDDGMPWAVASVAIQEPLLPDEVAIKNYSENVGILDTLLDADIIYPPHREVSTGYVRIPICKIKRP